MCLTVVAILALGSRTLGPTNAPPVLRPAGPGTGAVTIRLPRAHVASLSLFALASVSQSAPTVTFPAEPSTVRRPTRPARSTSCFSNRRGHAGETCRETTTGKERIHQAVRWLKQKVQSHAVAVPGQNLRKLQVPHPYHKYLRHLWKKRHHPHRHHRRS